MGDGGISIKGAKPKLYLFAKTPVPGEVKTRLTKMCTAEQAAEIASVLIKATVELAVSAWQGEICLCVWPDKNHPLFRELATKYALNITRQVDGDLGAKMCASLGEGIIQQGAAAVMGCDVPHCPGVVLKEAYKALEARHNVIGPSVDGGFYFLGLYQFHPAIFDGVSWGCTNVYRATLSNLQKCKFAAPDRLSILRDIDYWDDLVDAAKVFNQLKPYVI